MKHRFTAAIVAALAFAGAGCGATQAPPPVHQQATAAHSYMGSVHPPGWGAPQLLTGAVRPQEVATAEQFDSVTLGTLPFNARFLAGYVDGHWPTFGPMTRLSWHPSVKSIAVFYGDRAACGDFEPGDMTPSQAPAFWHLQHDRYGITRPCIYSSLWEFIHQVIPILAAAGIPRAAYWAWDADYTYRQHLDPGFDATQWTPTARGRNLDESTATLAFLGAQPVQAPDPLHYRALTPAERSVVLHYDGARKHVARYRQYLGYVLMPRLGVLANRIYRLAHGHGDAWLARNRWVRFPALRARSLGQQLAR